MTKVFLIILLIIVVSCNESQIKRVNENEIQLTGFSKTGSIQFNVISEYEESFPQEMHFLDTVIIIHKQSTPIGGNWIEVLDTTGKRISSLFSNGRGPEELLSISSSGLINDNLWLYDFQNTMLWIVEDVLTNKPIILTKKEIRKRLHKIELWNDSILLTVSNITGANYKIDTYNYLTDQIIGGLGNLNTLPEIIDVIPYTGTSHDGIELFVEKGVFFGNYRVKPDRNRIAIAYSYFDAIEIYSKNSDLIKAIRGPINIFPDLKTSHNEYGSGLIHPDNTMMGYRSIACTDNYIYAAFSGSYFFDYKADKIFVFDWDGNAIKSFNLNYPIGAFCVDEKNNIIYSVSTNTGELIKGHFDLN